MRKSIIINAAICTLLILSGCGATHNDLSDLTSMNEIIAISRENGSGTREEFEKLIKTNADGTDNVALSTDDMSNMISSDINSVGYVSFSAAPLPQNVKAISVNGISLNEKSISNGKYLLCRSYYIAYNKELSPVGTDFIAYIMSAGQDIVEKECVKVKKSSSFLSDKSSGELTIRGSSSIAPLMNKMAEDYYKYNPNAVIKITATDSSDGLNAAIRGECNIAMSSRELTDYENELLMKKAVAKDGIAVIVNAQNPITNLSDKQIKKIYDNKVSEWKDLK